LTSKIDNRLRPKKVANKEYLIDVLLFSRSRAREDQRPDFRRSNIPFYILGSRKAGYSQLTVKLSSSSFPPELLKTYITDLLQDKKLWKKIKIIS
jgi:hypothetical protein